MSEREELAFLKQRFGTDGNWVEFTMPLTATEVEKHFGSECKKFDHNCIACRAWSDWYRTGKVTITLERDELVKLLIKKNRR